MRILYLIQSLGVGGVERQFIQLAEGLSERGHSVRLCAIHVYTEGWEWLQQSRRVPVVALQDEPPSGAVSSLGQGISTIKRLRRIFTEDSTEIVHTANTGLTASLAWFACRGRSKPLTVWAQRGGMGLTRKSKRAFHHTLSNRFSRFISAGTPALIANSEAGCDALRRDGFRCRSFHVVPNGIDCRRFQRDEAGRQSLRRHWGFEDATPVIGFVGRPAPVKRPEDFLQAAALLVRRRPEVGLVLVGGIDAAQQAPYRHLADELGLTGRVRWECDRSDMPSVFSALDVLCLSSESEGHPNVIAEAMACGTPCVATDVGAVTDILSSHGVVVKPIRDPAALALGLETLLDRLATLDRGPLRDSIVSRFSLETFIETMEDLYSRILADQGSGRH